MATTMVPAVPLPCRVRIPARSSATRPDVGRGSLASCRRRRPFSRCADAATVRRRRTWVLLGLIAATVATLGLLLNGNIRYQVGVGRVSGYSVAETFSHRPIVFRLASAAQAWLPNGPAS